MHLRYWKQYDTMFYGPAACGSTAEINALQNPLTLIEDGQVRHKIEKDRTLDDGFIEFAVFMRLSPEQEIDSVWIQTTEKYVAWVPEVTEKLRKTIKVWPTCRVPFAVPGERWVVVLPYSLLSFQFYNPARIRLPLGQDFQRMLGDFTKHNLTQVFPTMRSPFGSLQ